MSSKEILKKNDIFSRIIGSGINITPKALDLLFNSNLTGKDIEEIIRKISFNQNFRSHITVEKLTPLKLENNKTTTTKKTSERNNTIKKIPESQKVTGRIVKKKIQIDDNIAKKQEYTNILDKKKSAENNIISKSTPISKNYERNKKNTEIKHSDIKVRSLNNRKTEISPNFSDFKPIASEYNEDIRILSDPSRNLYTTGSIDDFFHLMNNKFESLKDILLKNPEVKDLSTIRNLKSFSDSREIGIIGMVKDKRIFGEDQHIRLTIEDPTGEISVIIRNDERNDDVYKQTKYLLTDQVIYINGYLKVDSRKNSRVIFGNNILWPDIPIQNRTSIPDSPISIALISDIHIGSKNFMENVFRRFIKYLRCEIGSEKERIEAGKIKYLVIAGDLVEGVGIYPGQERELEITDIYQQFKYTAKIMENIPNYIKVIYSPGNHEPVRNALPYPAVPEKFCPELTNLDLKMVGNPCLMSLDGIKLLCFHGDSILDLNMSIPGLSNDKPQQTMKEYLRNRHLAPIYGGNSEIAPTTKDWLVINEIPHILHCGHIHINGIDYYRNVLMINSGCFQSQTDFMRSVGVVPTPGLPVIVTPESGKLNSYSLNLNI